MAGAGFPLSSRPLLGAEPELSQPPEPDADAEADAVTPANNQLVYC